MPYQQPADVQPCLDSSRYFVVRIARGQANVIVGLGFEERTDAFKFKSALQEWEHRRDAQHKAQAFFDEMPQQGDLRLQEGQMIRIDLAGKVKSKAGGEASVVGAGIGAPGAFQGGLGMPAVAAAKKKEKVGIPNLALLPIRCALSKPHLQCCRRVFFVWIAWFPCRALFTHHACPLSPFGRDPPLHFHHHYGFAEEEGCCPSLRWLGHLRLIEG